MVKQMAVNANVSFETLYGLIGRANDNERLMIADEWLRANKSVSIPQYQELRKLWNDMGMKYGTFRIIIRAGSVKHQYLSKLSYAEAYRICEDSNWEHNHNGGLMWDMEIEEEY